MSSHWPELGRARPVSKVRPPRPLEREAFRTMLRERQGFCSECGAVVEGVHRFHVPSFVVGRARWGEVPCTRCGEPSVFGAWEYYLRGELRLSLPTTLRSTLDVQLERPQADVLFPSGCIIEGSDECTYLWVNGEGEVAEYMSDLRLQVVIERYRGLSETERRELAEAIGQAEPASGGRERERSMTSRSDVHVR